MTHTYVMTPSELRRWLARRGCTFETHKRGSGHLTIIREGRRSQLPMHGSRKDLGSGLVAKINSRRGSWCRAALADLLAILLTLSTGMRRGEILAVRWKHVDLEQGLISIVESLEQTKGKLRFKTPVKARAITLPPFPTEELRRPRYQQAEQLMPHRRHTHAMLLLLAGERPSSAGAPRTRGNHDDAGSLLTRHADDATRRGKPARRCVSPCRRRHS